MENNRKIDLISLIITCAIVTVCITMSITFYNITKSDYTAPKVKSNAITINKELYNKIVDSTQKSEDMKASTDDFGRTNPFEKK